MMLMTAAQTAPVTAMQSEVDLELFTFLERYATSLFRWDLLLHFGADPDASYTAAEIAESLQRSVFATTKELDDLTYLRVLRRRYTPERTTYTLSRRANIRRSVMRLSHLANPPQVPLKVQESNS